MGEDPRLVRQAVNTHGYTAPVLLDRNREAAKAYLVTATPTVYFVDRRSQIVGRDRAARLGGGDGSPAHWRFAGPMKCSLIRSAHVNRCARPEP